MRFFQYISMFVFIGLVGFFVYQYSPHYQIIKGEIFGTYYTVKIQTDTKDKQLKEKIEARLQEINASQSIFIDDSEVSLINQAQAGKKIKLSPDMRNVLQAAAKIYQQTDGAFDPSLGKLIDLWGFGASSSVSPDDKVVKKVLQSTGFNKFKFTPDYQYVTKSKKDLFLNLSGIAKGYGVDAIASLLKNEGYNNFIVEIGGEIKAEGYRNEVKEAWVVGINKPSALSHENVMAVSLSNIAVATSGNYRNFYEVDGQKYGHTISPVTGYPVITDVLSASVFNDSCMKADAYATAIVVMGVEKGLAFANKHKLKVIIYDNEYHRHLSLAAQEMFQNENAQ